MWIHNFQPVSGFINNNGSTYIAHSLGSKDPSKSFPRINSFNSQNSVRQELLLYPFFFPRWRNRSTERLSDFPNITQPENGARTWTQQSGLRISAVKYYILHIKVCGSFLL